MRPIEGTAPNPAHVPKGCHYAPRCPLATSECHQETPPWVDIEGDHRSACFHTDEAADAVPFDLEEVSDA
jgi:oligopeptide/dipeptide ABC transporter ATP-binding protein